MTDSRRPSATRHDGDRLAIVVAAESAAVAARVETMLRSDPDVRIVVRSLAELSTLALDDDPAIAILAASAQTAARTLETLGRGRRIPLIILMTPEPHAAWTARTRRSVRAILRHDATADELRAALAATRAGLLVLHPDVLRDARTTAAAATAAPPLGESTTLTPREAEILEMMAEGMRNRAIGARLKISPHTVKFHVASILTKLAARSRTEAVTVGVRQGLISL